MSDHHSGPIERLRSLIHQIEEAIGADIKAWSERDAREVQQRLDRLTAWTNAIVHQLIHR
jgi:hypothetical protein